MQVSLTMLKSARKVVSALVPLLVIGLTKPASAQIAFEEVTIPAGFIDTGSETWGAAWGDIDGDNYPDIFTSNHRTRAALFRNNRNGTFVDVSGQVDVSDVPGWTGGRSDVDKHGAMWGDVDNDGDDDLYMSVSSSDSYLLINENGLLTDRTSQYGVDLLSHGATRMNLFLDYTGDGLLDLASIALRKPAFSPQLPNGTFGRGSSYERPTACSTDAQWAHLTDIHPSPGLELLCATRTGYYPYINAFENGVISNVSVGVPDYARTVIDAASLDYNGDLRPDLFLLRSAERPSDFYQPSPQQLEAQLVTAKNKVKSVTFKSTGILTLTVSLREGSDPQGNPAYIDIGSILWSPTSLTFQLSPTDSRNWGTRTGSYGINIGYTTATGEWKISQGNPDYSYSYVQVSSSAPITDVVYSGASASDIGYKPLLFSNTSSGFVDIKNAGFTVKIRCQSVVAADFDNDMDEDLFLACSGGAENIANKLYMNQGNGKFVEIAGASGAAGWVGAAVADGVGTSESVVTADYDLDGFVDLFVTNGNNMRPLYIGGAKQLFRNLGNSNSWMEFDLVGIASNRDGIGAKIYVTAGDRTQYREQNGGYHRWSQNFMRTHVGLGSNSSADVTVEWPNGTTTVHSGLPSNRIYQLKQDGTSIVIFGQDSDGDGLDDTREPTYGTDPNNPDTDGDGLLDGAEVSVGTNPLLQDTDGEGLSDGDEVNTYGTNPLERDTDSDGLTDRVELLFKRTNPLDSDSDDDGLTDGQEAASTGYGTDPLDPDTDGGGIDDGTEIGRGTDPLFAGDD